MQKTDKKILIKKSVLEEFIKRHLDCSVDLTELLDSDSWPTSKRVELPAVVNEPPMEDDHVVISPAAQTQVAEPDYPLDDPEWCPGSKTELQKASSQLVDKVPDGQIKWFWGRLKNLVEKAESQIAGEPGTGDMEYEAETLPQDKQRQRTSEKLSSEQLPH